MGRRGRRPLHCAAPAHTTKRGPHSEPPRLLLDLCDADEDTASAYGHTEPKLARTVVRSSKFTMPEPSASPGQGVGGAGSETEK